MGAVAFHSNSVLGFSMCFSYSRQRYLGRYCISMKEVAVQPSPFVFQKVVSPFTNSRIRCEGATGDQTSRRNEEKRSYYGKKTKSSDHEEMIALVKRIRISISKENPRKTAKRSSSTDKDKPSTETNRDTHGEPKQQRKAGNNPNRAKEKGLSKKIAVSQNVQEALEHPNKSGFKLTRLPSNFVKESPIPSLSTPRGNAIELTNGPVKITKVPSERLEELKLTELKELAKSRGVKCYSKMKKSELIKILGS